MRGFLFEHSLPDANAPLGARRTRIAAIAETRRDALGLAGEILPSIAMRLIDEGPDALRTAQDAGVADGEAKIIG